MRIRVPHEDPTDARLEDPPGAGPGAPGVAAGLERDRQRRTAQGPRPVLASGGLDGHDLGVRAARWLGAAPPENALTSKHDGTHRRVRKDASARRTPFAKGRAHGRLGRHSGSVSPIAAKKAA